MGRQALALWRWEELQGNGVPGSKPKCRSPGAGTSHIEGAAGEYGSVKEGLWSEVESKGKAGPDHRDELWFYSKAVYLGSC